MAAVTGNVFGRAVCEHFGIDPKRVLADCTVNTMTDGLFSVSLTLPLTADDLAAISARMKGQEPKRNLPHIPQPSPFSRT